MNRQTLLVRADAGIAMGTGHVMRCLALVQAWRGAGGSALFVMSGSPPALIERVRKESAPFFEIDAKPGTNADATATTALARQHDVVWIAVDGYHFDAAYQRALKNAGFRVLFLDDYGHAVHYHADAVLNQNISADKKLYENREPYTRLLLGPRYCLLRREFSDPQPHQIAAVGHRVLIAMGGSDPENFTEKAVAALNSVEDAHLEAIVVVGGSNVRGSLLETIPANTGKKITLRHDVSNMAELMAWADVAISAAGTTCWELCRMGLPSLLIDLAENQTQLAQQLDQRGCAIHLGNAREVSSHQIAERLKLLLQDQELRQRISSRALEVVDGQGAKRVVSALRGKLLRLRPACENDCRLLWEWANDEQVRAASFTPAQIPWATHVVWFKEKLNQEGCHIWIAEDLEHSPVAQVRFDRRVDGEYEIALSVSADHRGQGLAVPMIEQALQLFSASANNARIHAFVKPENTASLKAFDASGFDRVAAGSIQGQPAVHFILEAKTNDDRTIDVLLKECAS